MIEALAGYVHAMSMALWFGGLFGYVMIVWPEILRGAAPELPRSLLVSIGTRTAPWIYLAMVSALGSFFVFWAVTDIIIPVWAALLYLIVLLGLIANNLYGSFASWPTIMMAPEAVAWSAWKRFFLRMAISMVLGLSQLSLTFFVI